MTQDTLSTEEVLPLLKKQSDKAKRLLRGPKSSVTWIQALSWRNTTLEILLQIFGNESRNIQLFLQAKNFIPKNSSFPGYFFLEGSHNLLLGFIEQLEMGIIPEKSEESEETGEINRNILIINGQNVNLRESVLAFLHSINLEPVQMEKIPEEGKTLLDTFASYADKCSFAIIFLTGEEIGKPALSSAIEPSNFGTAKKSEMAKYKVQKERTELKKRRARENEIFELGFFIGRMGRSRVRVLSDEIFERPTDVDGVLYIPFDEKWKDRLTEELRESGINVNM